MKIIFLLAILSSCTLLTREKPLLNFNKKYIFTDTSGEFLVDKTYKKIKDENVTRTLLKTPDGKLVLEKTTSVSKVKITPDGLLLLPKIAEHKVWFSKKEYYSRIEADLENKRYKVTLRSPEVKWNGVKYFDVPVGKKICWYSQLPECLKMLGLLDFSSKPRDFLIIWDTYPYYAEQLTGVDEPELFSTGRIFFDSDFEGFKRFEVSIKDNAVFYFYSDKKEFNKYFWIAQGISMIEKKE